MMKSARGRKWADLLELHGEEVLLLPQEGPCGLGVGGQNPIGCSGDCSGMGECISPKIERGLVAQIRSLAARLEKRRATAQKGIG